MTEYQACQGLTDKIEAVLAGQRRPVRVRCVPCGAHGYQVTAAGWVPADLAAQISLAAGAERVTIHPGGKQSIITLE